MEVMSYAVTDVLFDYREAVFFDVRLDRVTDVTEPCALLACHFNSAVEGFASYVDKTLSFIGNTSYRKGIGAVTVEAADICSDVYLDYVAFLENAGTGNTVNYLVIHRDTSTCGKSAIAEK